MFETQNFFLKYSLFIFLTLFFVSCTPKYQQPALAHQETTHNIKHMNKSKKLLKDVLSSNIKHMDSNEKLLEGILPSDIARTQAFTKKLISPYWSSIRQRSQYVRQRMIATLKDMHAPIALQIVPIVESGYQPYALSPTGAMGLWQLMPATAHSLGIRKNPYMDGRRHIEQSTQAAVKYLQQQHQRFHNWPLAFAAYNMGPSALAKRLKKSPWHLKDGLESMPVPQETLLYVRQVIGLVALLKMGTLKLPEPIHTQPVHLQHPIDIKALTQTAKLPKQLLFKLNPSLHYSQYFTHDMTIHVPETSASFLKAKQAIKPHQYIKLHIHSGDSLWQLAKQYHTTLSHLKRLNPHLHKPLKINSLITVPAHGYAHAIAALNPLLSQGRRMRYKVRKGDSLWRIAHRFGTTTHAIARANQLNKKAYIRPGDTLWILAHIRPS